MTLNCASQGNPSELIEPFPPQRLTGRSDGSYGWSGVFSTFSHNSVPFALNQNISFGADAFWAIDEASNIGYAFSPQVSFVPRSLKTLAILNMMHAVVAAFQ